MLLGNFIKALIIGLGASIPLGPVGIVCIQKTISKGRYSGLSAGLGATLADSFYATVALLSLAIVQQFITASQVWILIIGGVIILVTGISIAMKNPVKQLRQPKQNANSSKYAQDFGQGLLMTISNPGALVLMLGLFTYAGIETGNPYEPYNAAVIIGGVALGSVSWWFVLSLIISIFRNRFRLRQLLWLNRISGLAIAILGLVSAAEGILQLIQNK